MICIFYTIPKTNVSPARKPIQKESSVPTINFLLQVAMLVREGISCIYDVENV